MSQKGECKKPSYCYFNNCLETLRIPQLTPINSIMNLFAQNICLCKHKSLPFLERFVGRLSGLAPTDGRPRLRLAASRKWRKLTSSLSSSLPWDITFRLLLLLLLLDSSWLLLLLLRFVVASRNLLHRWSASGIWSSEHAHSNGQMALGLHPVKSISPLYAKVMSVCRQRVLTSGINVVKYG